MTIPDDRPRARALHERAQRRIPGGVSSNVRLDVPHAFFERGNGAWLHDVDGFDYVDYLLGQGPQFLGHAHPAVVEAVTRACKQSTVFAAQHELEVEAAERVCAAVGWADQVRFGLTGTEAVQVALRIARAATGRRRFVCFEGHYHGWLDNVLARKGDHGPATVSAGQLSSHLEDCIMVPWNDLEALRKALDAHGDDVAAILTEPMMANSGAILPRPGYLEGMRRLCDKRGIVLIFDEVITGFRLHLGGAAARFAVTPDLAIYGKAMAGGYPVSAVAGRSGLLAAVGTGEINHSGTFNGHTIGAAATIATLGVLSEQPPYEQINKIGSRLMAELQELAVEHNLDVHLQGLPQAFHLSFGSDQPIYDFRDLQKRDGKRYQSFACLLREEGVWVASRGIWYLSIAHSDREVTTTLERVETAMRRIA